MIAASRFDNRHVILPTRYLACVDYYAMLAAYPSATIETGNRFDKRRKETHRTVIADANGTINLTIPIEKPVSHTQARWDDIVISSHGKWWNVHLTALKSAYGRTPFFEYYLDDFLPFYTSECAGMRLTEYNSRLDALLRRLLYIDTEMSAPGKDIATDNFSQCNLPSLDAVEYYQVRNLRYGFIPSLSVVDLLFNMGPESQIILHEMTGNHEPIQI